MSDLYEDARPVRDAAMAEVTRLTQPGGADFCPLAREANVLGVHLAAVMMAFAANRHKKTQGPIHDEGWHRLLAGAIGTLIANAAMGFRPVDPAGRPASATSTALFLLDMIAASTMQQTQINEQGLQDFIIPIRRSEDGRLEVTPFDVNEILNDMLKRTS